MTKKTISRARLALGSCLAAAALLLAAGGANAASGLTLTDTWMRFLASTLPAAGYFTLSNDMDKSMSLVGASSPACGTLMLHHSENVNGEERMVMVKNIPVPAHGKVEFAPGGYHLMCMSPKAAMKVGATVPVTLRFADKTTMTASFPVRSATGK
jgi:periplasmic copper chaperone A